MSLILEALRKSEAERRRDHAPRLEVELPPVPSLRPRAAHWPWLLLVAALALLGVLLAAWLRRHPTATPTPPPAPASASVASSAPALASAPTPPPVTQVPPRLPEAPVAAMAAPAGAPVRRQATQTPPAPAAAVPAAASAPTMPANDAIPDIAATALPPVRMSMHMWDPDPARRFVILDGQRMGEGDRSGGLTVLTIDRTGVVIERDGQRARIPLP